MITNISFGGASSSQPTHLDDVQCTSGIEQNLLNCTHAGIGIHNCDDNHAEDVGIICKQSKGDYFLEIPDF